MNIRTLNQVFADMAKAGISDELTIKTTIHYYYLDVSIPESAETYNKLKEQLKAEERPHWMHCHGDTKYNPHRATHSEEITLECKCLFNNQWNTECGKRVFDWYEGVYPNKHLRIGHWLEQTDEMKAIRAHTHACGYCGKQTVAPEQFCTKCLGSQYLTEEQIHLLRMQPISVDRSRAPLTDTESAILIPAFIDAQTTTDNKRVEGLRASLIAECATSCKNAEVERDGFLWLLDNAIKIDNVIYYTHTKRFSFGWRTAVSDGLKSRLLDLLCEFHYPYEIKCADGTKIES